MDSIQKIKTVVESADSPFYEVITPILQCGFSMRTVEALKACGAEFECGCLRSPT